MQGRAHWTAAPTLRTWQPPWRRRLGGPPTPPTAAIPSAPGAAASREPHDGAAVMWARASLRGRCPNWRTCAGDLPSASHRGASRSARIRLGIPGILLWWPAAEHPGCSRHTQAQTVSVADVASLVICICCQPPPVPTFGVCGAMCQKERHAFSICSEGSHSKEQLHNMVWGIKILSGRYGMAF